MDKPNLSAKFKIILSERIYKHSFAFCFGLFCALTGVNLYLTHWLYGLLGGIAFGFIGIVPYRNYLFAFSLPVPGAVMYSMYAAVLVVAMYFFQRAFVSRKHLEVFAWILVLAGAAVNVGERLYFGYVRDYFFIRLLWDGYLNISDIYIIFGILILLLLAWKKQAYPGKI